MSTSDRLLMLARSYRTLIRELEDENAYLRAHWKQMLETEWDNEILGRKLSTARHEISGLRRVGPSLPVPRPAKSDAERAAEGERHVTAGMLREAERVAEHHAVVKEFKEQIARFESDPAPLAYAVEKPSTEYANWERARQARKHRTMVQAFLAEHLHPLPGYYKHAAHLLIEHRVPSARGLIGAWTRQGVWRLLHRKRPSR
jgi:hypothetical protein